MAILKYVNFSLVTSGHGGTSADPYNLNDFISNIESLSADTDYSCQGSNTLYKNILYNKNYNVNISAWDISVYGPWRLNFGAVYSFQDKSSATYGDKLNISNGIIYDVSAIWLKSINSSFIYNNVNGSIVISRDVSASTLIYNTNIDRVFSAFSNYNRCLFYSLNNKIITSANVYNSHVNSLISANFISGVGVSTSGNLYSQVYNTIPNWSDSNLYNFSLGHNIGVGLNWASHPGYYYIDLEKTIKGNGSLEKPGTLSDLYELNSFYPNSTYKCKGTYTFFERTDINLDGVILDAWDTSAYGPWRFIINWPDDFYGNGLNIRGGCLKNGIIYNLRDSLYIRTYSASNMFFCNDFRMTDNPNPNVSGTFENCVFYGKSGNLIQTEYLLGTLTVTFKNCLFATKSVVETGWYNVCIYDMTNAILNFDNCKSIASQLSGTYNNPSNPSSMFGTVSVYNNSDITNIELNTDIIPIISPYTTDLTEFTLGTDVGPDWAFKGWNENGLFGLWGEERDGVGAFYFGALPLDTSAVYYVDLELSVSGHNGTYNDPYDVNDFIFSYSNMSANNIEYRIKGQKEISSTFTLQYNGSTDIRNLVFTSWNNLLYGPWRFKFLSGASIDGSYIDNFIIKDGIIYSFNSNNLRFESTNLKFYNMFFWKKYISPVGYGIELYGDNNSMIGNGPKFYGCTIASDNNNFPVLTNNLSLEFYDTVFNCTKIQLVYGPIASSIFYNCVTPRTSFNSTSDTGDIVTSAQYNWTSPSWPLWDDERNLLKYSLLGNGITRIPTVTDIIRFGMWDSLRNGIGSFYFDYEYGHIGSFYFGPLNENINASVFTLSAQFLEPEISVVNSVSSTIISPVLVTEYRLLQPKAIYAYQDIMVDFSAKPITGISPLVVEFNAIVNFGGKYKNIYKVKEYRWCFNYDYDNDICLEDWIITIENPIKHVYLGYNGQKFSVRCCVTIELI